MALAAMTVVLLVVTGVFLSLVLAIEGLHTDANNRRHYLVALQTADQAELSVVDLETGLRGYLLTHQSRFLQPYWQARATLPSELASLRTDVAGDRREAGPAGQLIRSIESYEQTYAEPIADHGPSLPPAQVVRVTSDGKRLLDAIRGQFARFEAAEGTQAQRFSALTDSSAHHALLITSAGLLVVVLILGALAGYLQRWILIPITRVARAARRRQHGEQGVRVAETGRGEIVSLARSFNAMADALEERDRALTTARDRLQGVLDHAETAIYLKDAGGRYLLVNHAFERARNLEAANVIGRTEADFSPPEVAEQIAADDRSVVATGETLANEYTVPTPSGLRTYWSVKFMIPAAEGEAVTIGGISTDITEHKRALTAAMETSRLKSQFVANMSHEIRTPLNA